MSADPPPLFAEPASAPAEHLDDSAWREVTDQKDHATLATDGGTAPQVGTQTNPEPDLEPEPEPEVSTDRTANGLLRDN